MTNFKWLSERGWGPTCVCYLNVQLLVGRVQSARRRRDLWAVTWLIDWENIASWVWQLYEPSETIKTQVEQALLLLPGLRLEKHTGNGERMSAWSEFILICFLLSHLQQPQWEKKKGSLSYSVESNIYQLQCWIKEKEQCQINRSTHKQVWADWKKEWFPAFHIPGAPRWEMDGSVFVLVASSWDDTRKHWKSCISV